MDKIVPDSETNGRNTRLLEMIEAESPDNIICIIQAAREYDDAQPPQSLYDRLSSAYWEITGSYWEITGREV